MLPRPSRLLCATVIVGLAVAPLAAASPPKDGPIAGVAAPMAVPELARLTSPNLGASYLRVLGRHAAPMLAPRDGILGALVALPKGSRAEDFGLDPAGRGMGRLRGTPESIVAFADAHPGMQIEVGPPLQPLMDRAGHWIHATTARLQGFDGRGVLVGVADTGLDVLNKEMRDANGKSRVKWMLDLSLKPGGGYPELEDRFGVKNAAGTVTQGRVFAKRDIDVMISRFEAGACTEGKGRDPCAPTDEQGHGTHVTGIAAGSGVNGSPYAGSAPGAEIVFVRVTRQDFAGILNDDLERAVEFMFDRADAEKMPMVVNVSLGADFGPHDGTAMWEQNIASHVGPDKPGRAIVAAAGNSGSIVESPIHQSVYVSRAGRVRVPVRSNGAVSGQVQIWVTLRNGADLKIGLDGPDGEWIAPVEEHHQNAKNTDDYQSGVIYGPEHEGSVIPPTSRGAVVVWTGKWPKGTYYVTFEGSGMAELYLQGIGDAALGGPTPTYFVNAVRENTITLPGTHPSIIAVGCTVNRPRWTSVANVDMALKVPLLDPAGGVPLARTLRSTDPTPTHRELLDGEVCWFGSAGPTVTGVPKPEIAAPGALVASAVSRTARPPNPGSIFTNSNCPKTRQGTPDNRCMLVDDTHGVSNGTSMSSPMVAGVVATLLQQDPTLTQDKIVALLQAGAHRFRASHVFDAYDDQSGPGEVDVLGSLDALEQSKNPALFLPSYEQSWITLSAEYVAADASTPMTAIIELRTQDAQHRGDFFDASRLRPDLRVNGSPVEPQPELVRRGPGVWFYTWTPPRGLGGSFATFGATFDGAPIVPARTVPIATDRWTSGYPSEAAGSGCATTPRGAGTLAAWLAPLALGLARVRRRRAR